MNEKKLSFDGLPQAVGKLFLKLEKIERLLQLSNLEQQENKEELPITISEVANILNLSKATIYSKVSRNEIPFAKRGNRLYFYKSEISKYLKEGKKKTFEEMQEDAHNYLGNSKSKAA